MQEQLDRILQIVSGGGVSAVSDAGLLALSFVMAVALASALLCSFLYLSFYSTRATGSQVHRSFPLVGISVTALFICIQFSLPLSLGLLGALSIVRFRTPIKEPEEIGFIMLVIASAIACATFNLAFLGVLFAAAIVALLVQQRVAAFRGTTHDGTIIVSMSEQDYRERGPAVTALLRDRLVRARLESVAKNGGDMALAYNFQGVSEGALHSLEAELDEAAKGSSFSIFLNRAGTP